MKLGSRVGSEVFNIDEIYNSVAVFLPSIAIADPYTIESQISAFSLKDQHYNQYEIDETFNYETNYT